jgi:hypothetical protein
MSTLFINPGKEYSYFFLFDRCYQHKFLAQGNDGKNNVVFWDGAVWVYYIPARRHIREDGIRHSHSRENLKS